MWSGGNLLYIFSVQLLGDFWTQRASSILLHGVLFHYSKQYWSLQWFFPDQWSTSHVWFCSLLISVYVCTHLEIILVSQCICVFNVHKIVGFCYLPYVFSSCWLKKFMTLFSLVFVHKWCYILFIIVEFVSLVAIWIMQYLPWQAHCYESDVSSVLWCWKNLVHAFRILNNACSAQGSSLGQISISLCTSQKCYITCWLDTDCSLPSSACSTLKEFHANAYMQHSQAKL